MTFEVTHNAVEVSAYTSRDCRPAVIIPRSAGEAWFVRCLPVAEPGDGWEWSLEGAHLRVPLFPYFIHSTDAELAISFGVQLGLQVMLEVAGGDDVVRAHVAVGYPTEDLGDRLRYWCGLAFLLRRRENP